jgi:FMN phosphatase YigB (HAD superfamily)
MGDSRGCLLFDVGNVLVDFDHRIVSRYLADHVQGTSADLAAHVHTFVFGDSGPASLNAQVDRGTLSLPALHAMVVERFSLDLPFAAFRDAWSSIFASHLNHGLVERLTRCAATDLDAWICSNTNLAHWAFLCATFPLFAELDARDHCFLSFRLGQVKTDSGFFAHVVGRTGYPAPRHVLIDDREDNCRAARDGGLLALHVPDGRSVSAGDSLDAFLLERGLMRR